ncbi:MAG: PQQ-binding-like beta-propeller repeat protein, partial [Planctomycetes bacterium]|nr:PQQ-binding-like beta-propeller repeat protein [Planctomycetota bacterium]
MVRGRLGPNLLFLAVGLACLSAGVRRVAAAEAGDAGFLQLGPGGAAIAAEEKEETDPASGEGQNVFAPPDRATLRLLSKAQQLIEQDRHAEAVRLLGAIFDSPQDYFFYPEKDGSPPRSLKSEAQRLLGRVSRRGREVYELQYGARARQMLSVAAADGDALGLAEVSRRFFHTEAGYEATLLLGHYHLDHGRFQAGALALERLREDSPAADSFEPELSLAIATGWLRAGMAERAGEVLAALRKRLPNASVRVAGEEVAMFARGDDLVGWLAELVGPQTGLAGEQSGRWTMFRGNAARNATTRGDGPLLSRRWRVRTTGHPLVEALIAQVGQADRQWDRAPLPTLHPLAVDDVVLMRAAGNLLAVDFETGKRLWETSVDNPLEEALAPSRNLLYRRTSQLEHSLRLRMWADTTYGTISSDTERVFAIEDLGLEMSHTRFQVGFGGGRRADDPTGPKSYNRLAAYNVHNGKLQWHLGGSADAFGLAQAGTFFLGPPLPLIGRLYVIAETMGEIRLMVLDAETGKLLWVQQLAGTDQLLMKDPLRRMAGVSPSYADGVLVCPTSNRSIVAVDLANRSLLWGYAYRQVRTRSQRQVLFFGSRSTMDPDPAGRWIDSSVVLAEGRVLVTPVESGHLHCLSLRDGELLWKEPRRDDLYVACAAGGKVLLVGRRGVRALELHKVSDEKLDDQPGEPPGDAPEAILFEGLADKLPEEDDFPRPARAWEGRTVEFPEGSTPSGMGFLSGGVYYVPLSSAEVIAINVDSGRVVGASRSRQGSVPGNLVCHDGRILSQDATGLDAFDQLTALRTQVDQRLATVSEDAESLRLRGEILWAEGKLDEAIGCFRRSAKSSPEADTRELLREALFDGLRRDFAGRRGDVVEIRQLIEQPDQEATFLRLMAVGLAGAGEHGSALEHYLKLVELDRDHRNMESVGGSLRVRRDRWIQVQLAALRESGSVEVRDRIDSVAAARLKAAVEESDPEAVERFLDYFGAQPIAGEARRRLTRQYIESGELLAAELLLRRRERSQDARQRGAAVAELAKLLRRSKRWQDAAIYYGRLEEEFRDVVCLDGKTGRELVESLPVDEPVRDRLRMGSLWPMGKVAVAKNKPAKPARATYNQAALQFDGDRAPFFSDATIELHQGQPSQLVGRDSLGSPRWRLLLTERANRGHFLFNRGLMRVSASGHLLFLTSGQRILAMNTLDLEETGSPRILWSHDLDSPGSDRSDDEGLRAELANLLGGAPRLRPSAYSREPMYLPKIVSEQVLCFKQVRQCTAIDPWTGKMLWTRQDLPREGDLFGDHEYVFSVPAGETTASVYRASDGELLGRREVPLDRARAYGRRVLVWRAAEGYRVLEMVDPWEGRKLWPPVKCMLDATLHHVSGQVVGVYEPGGRFLLVDLDDGRTIVEAKLEPQPALPDVIVLPSPDRYLVITYDRRPSPDPTQTTHAMHGIQSTRIDRGRAYAFDRQGNALWPSALTIENQWLPLSQPSRTPVLTFACMVQEQRANQRAQAKTSILAIDKRNGREIYREQFKGGTNCFRLVGDLEKRTMAIQL